MTAFLGIFERVWLGVPKYEKSKKSQALLMTKLLGGILAHSSPTARPGQAKYGLIGAPKTFVGVVISLLTRLRASTAPNEQKIKPIESISICSVHFTLNLPQASQLLGMTVLLQH
jgi:hypothetical protein